MGSQKRRFYRLTRLDVPFEGYFCVGFGIQVAHRMHSSPSSFLAANGFGAQAPQETPETRKSR